MPQEFESLPQTEEELMPLVLKIAPGFKQRWQEHLEYWGNEKAGIYNDIAEFAHYVVDSYENGDTCWYEDFFQFVERLIVNGNEEKKELTIIGFLEDIQTIASWKSHKGKVFIKWLGPKSKDAWNQLYKLWSKYGSLANIIRSEKSQKQ